MEIEDLFFVGYPLWRFVELDEVNVWMRMIGFGPFFVG
jgi:hypothetical protein